MEMKFALRTIFLLAAKAVHGIPYPLKNDEYSMRLEARTRPPRRAASAPRQTNVLPLDKLSITRQRDSSPPRGSESPIRPGPMVAKVRAEVDNGGYTNVNSHADLDHAYDQVKHHIGEGHQTASHRNAAVANVISNGPGGTSAQGYVRVSATVEPKAGGKAGCIRCVLPGDQVSPPDIAVGAGSKKTQEFSNLDPKLGPARVYSMLKDGGYSQAWGAN